MTVNETVQILNYETVTSVTNDPLMVLAIVLVWFFPLIIYFLVGLTRKARTGSGSLVLRNGKPIKSIQSVNFWIAFGIWFFIQGALFYFILINPLWLKFL